MSEYRAQQAQIRPPSFSSRGGRPLGRKLRAMDRLDRASKFRLRSQQFIYVQCVSKLKHPRFMASFLDNSHFRLKV